MVFKELSTRFSRYSQYAFSNTTSLGINDQLKQISHEDLTISSYLPRTLEWLFMTLSASLKLPF